MQILGFLTLRSRWQTYDGGAQYNQINGKLAFDFSEKERALTITLLTLASGSRKKIPQKYSATSFVKTWVGKNRLKQLSAQIAYFCRQEAWKTGILPKITRKSTLRGASLTWLSLLSWLLWLLWLSWLSCSSCYLVILISSLLWLSIVSPVLLDLLGIGKISMTDWLTTWKQEMLAHLKRRDLSRFSYFILSNAF